MSAVADKLREARALIGRGWTQGVFARDAGGRCVSPMSPDACCFCMMGAVERIASGTYSGDTLISCLEDALGVHDAIGITSFNDDFKRTQPQVLAAFDKAIELAERGQ